MSKLVIRYDLDKMSAEEQIQYLRDISEFLELDPDLNAFDLIWMPNPGGVGKTLVPYARRGTCELLRDKHVIDILDQSENVVSGSYVVRIKGKNKAGRIEIAIGSRSIEGLTGRDRDDAIMTASTRALQRLTMQFTGLGILSESEVVSVFGQPVNPANEAKLAGSPMVIPSTAINNAPGKPAEPSAEAPKPQTSGYPGSLSTAKLPDLPPEKPKADIQADTPKAETPTTSVESTTSVGQEEGQKDGQKPARKPRKAKNTVSFDVEPERVSKVEAAPTPVSEPAVCVDCKKPLSEHQMVNSERVCSVLISNEPSNETKLNNVSPSAPPVTQPAPVPLNAGEPTQEQMNEYRTKIAVFTKELTATVGMTATQRMRAFLAKMNGGTAPQNMNVPQWEKTLAWFSEYSAANGINGVVAKIDQTLGDK